MKIPCVTMLGAALLLLSMGRAAAITLEVDPSAQDVTIGSTVSVGLVISGLGSGTPPSLSTFDLDVLFDPGILSFLGFTFGDPILGDQLDLSSLGSITAVTAGAGSVNLFELSFDSTPDLDTLQSASFALGTLSFGAVSTGVSAVGISVNALGDADGGPLAAEALGGLVAVRAVRVPEPAALLLLLAGVAGCAASSRRADRRGRLVRGSKDLAASAVQAVAASRDTSATSVTCSSPPIASISAVARSAEPANAIPFAAIRRTRQVRRPCPEMRRGADGPS